MDERQAAEEAQDRAAWEENVNVDRAEAQAQEAMLTQAQAELEAREQGYAISQEQKADLEKRFSYHAPKGDQATRYIDLRRDAHALAALIMFRTPPSREQSLALTKLEECIMWANAGIARNE